MTAFGIDAGSGDLREADHLIHGLGLPEGAVACTHFVRGTRPHVAVSVRLPPGVAVDLWWERLSSEGVGGAWDTRRLGPDELSSGAAAAVADRRSGRAVVYPGVERLTGDVTVAAVLAGSAIDRIMVLAGQAEPSPSDVLRTRGHVRPEWRQGLLTLAVAPLGDGVFAPFEVPDPTPCCADHA